MVKHYLLLLLLITVITSCPGYHTGDLLQSGKNVIMRTKPTNNREFQYEALISFPFPQKGVQVLATTSTIGGYNPLPTTGCNYILSASRKLNSNSIIYKLLINNDQSWTSMQISYLVSGREDITIGNIQIPYSKCGRPAPNVYNIVHQVQKYLPKTNYKVAAFISGFSTTDSQFKLAINKRLFNYDTKEIVIGVYSSADPAILTFTLSYIVYPEVHAVLDISYSLESQGEIGSYQVSGPVSFGLDKKIQYNQWIVGNRLLECQGSQCSDSCELRQQCQQKNGNVWEGKCIYCAPGVIFQYGRCSKRCGANQVYVNRVCVCQKGFTRKGKDCIKANACGTNQIYDTVKGCICKDKCARYHNQCVECPAGSISTNDGNSCFCTSVNQIYSAVTHKCQNRCLQNQIWNNNRCNCLPKHCWWNQACRLCPQGSDATSDQYSCTCRGTNSFYHAQQNKCVECNGVMRLNQQRTGCVCKDGYASSGNSCIVKCKQSQIFNVRTGSCDCKPGLERSNGQCKIILKCDLNEQWDGKNCICIKEHAKYNGKCTKCPVGSLPNSLKNACICTNPNQIFNIAKFTCAACINNSFPSTDLTKCVCKKGYQLINKQCVLKCGIHEIANYNIGKCQCQFGYTRNTKDNTCQFRCQDKEQWNGNKCVCTAGNILVKGTCKPCPTNANGNTARDGCVCKIPNQIFDLNRFLCIACPLNSIPSPNHSSCICNKGYQFKNGACLSICNFDQIANPQTGLCQCKYGFMKLGPQCVERCGLNQEWNGKQCVCKIGNVKNNGVCKPCPAGSTTNSIRTKCVCQNKKHYFNINKFNCDACPANSSPNSDYSDFVCFSGYKRDGLSCINSCPNGALPNSAGQCICGGGLVLSDNSCKKPVICPKGSTWDQKTLECICDSKGFNLIDGACKACGENSIFNKSFKKCICNTGFFAIAGQCQVCDARTSYNGTDCVCNSGYFGDRNKCQKCHSTCSRCKGPEANQCSECSDVSLILEKGFCSKNTPCQPGFFLDDVACKKCSDNCIICKDLFKCQACAIGYDNEVSIIGQQKFELCTQICGDGIRFQAECDDGNTDDKDGCSSKCTVEAGWTCQGGSSSRKSKCNKFIPDQTVLSSKGAVNLGDRVVQSVRASYLPKCLTNNQCSKCFKILKVNVLDAFVPVLVKVNFVPFSQYQFLIEYDFQGLIVTSRFKVVIKLNEQFKGCLADDDFNQQIQLEIDPAFLAKMDVVQQLSLQDLGDDKQKIKVPKNAQSILGIGK